MKAILSTLKRALKIIIGFALSIVLILITVYLTYFDGWRDIAKGRFHRIAHEAFSEVADISKVNVYLLMADDSSSLSPDTFPLKPYGSDIPIYGQISLTGEELESFLEIWSYQTVSYLSQALCHQSAYGFRLYEGKRMVFETSVCWHCHNFYVTAWPGESRWYGFDADSYFAKELLKFCDERLPYPKDSEDSESDVQPEAQ